MLGWAVCPTFTKRGHAVMATDIRGTSPELQYLDVRDLGAVRSYQRDVSADAIVHLAAETSLEICEANVASAYTTNTIGTRNVATVCREADIPLVYVSTIGVFDGTKQSPYDEDDVPNPINVYGRTKWAGELVVDAMLDRWVIARAGWMIGGGDREKKFVALIIDQLRRGAKQIQVVTDKLGTPTYSLDFANGLESLLSNDTYGLFNLSSGATVSRFDVAVHIMKVLRRPDVEIIPIDSNAQFIRDSFPTARPRSEAMTSLKLNTAALNCMRRWDVALEEYLLTAYKADVAR